MTINSIIPTNKFSSVSFSFSRLFVNKQTAAATIEKEGSENDKGKNLIII